MDGQTYGHCDTKTQWPRGQLSENSNSSVLRWYSHSNLPLSPMDISLWFHHVGSFPPILSPDALETICSSGSSCHTFVLSDWIAGVKLLNWHPNGILNKPILQQLLSNKSDIDSIKWCNHNDDASYRIVQFFIIFLLKWTVPQNMFSWTSGLIVFIYLWNDSGLQKFP